MKPHFVEFLFHRNLSEKTVFMHLLQAFKSGKGYDDAFFTMFLNEAMQRDKPRVAVDLINTILFTEKGEPSVHALIFCPNIPVIIFEALLGAIVNISDGVLARVSDDMRVLLEIVLRFQYFALKMELGHIRSPARLFRDIPEKKAQFSALLEATSFLPHIIHVCNHNLAGRAEVIASAANMHHNDSFGSNATPTNVNMGMRMTSVSARSHEEDGGDIEPIDITLATVASTATGTAVAVKDVPQLDGGTDRAAASHVVHQNGAATTGAATGVGAGGSAAEHTQQQQSPGKDKYATWLDRNDGNLIALIYGFFTLVIRCGPIPALRDTTVVENETVVAFLQALDPAFYYVLLQPGTHLRARVTDFLREQFNIVSLYDKILGKSIYFISRNCNFFFCKLFCIFSTVCFFL